MEYELRIPMNKAARLVFDPFIVHNGRQFNEALFMMVEAFIVKYGKFPLIFNSCSHKQVIIGNDIVITFSEEGVTTRELKSGDLGYV